MTPTIKCMILVQMSLRLTERLSRRHGLRTNVLHLKEHPVGSSFFITFSIFNFTLNVPKASGLLLRWRCFEDVLFFNSVMAGQ